MCARICVPGLGFRVEALGRRVSGWHPTNSSEPSQLGEEQVSSQRAREIFIDNLLARVHLIIEMCRPASRHGSLSSLFQVALYPALCRSIVFHHVGEIRLTDPHPKMLNRISKRSLLNRGLVIYARANLSSGLRIEVLWGYAPV